MSKLKIKGKDLRKIKYKSHTAKSLAIDIMGKHFKHHTKNEQLEILVDILQNPEKYANHETLSQLAEEFMDVVETKVGTSYKLKDKPEGYKVYGRKFITQNTMHQMDIAMQLPISVKGALMPDAHVGYGLPIGGVLATENEVIPYGIGLDIGCRMSLSIYDVPAEFITKNSYKIKMAIREQTHFGIGKTQTTIEEHEVLDRGEFQQIELLKELHGKAKNQIGTSGSGNHFVEVGVVELAANNKFGLDAGNYVGVLAHSGSRGLGASIANYYQRVAMDTCWLPKSAQHLAWLDLNTEAGIEYWMAMNLAGDYAKACHDVIHHKMAKAIGLKPVVKIENHHNFAWKEKQADGRELIVHRKGATPAQAGQMGIIPATMIDPGYIVSGTGNGDSLHSASHGAGRKMSRSKAKSSITGSEVKKMLKNTGITLIGGGVDEAPMAYKNLEDVMGSQTDLVNVEGKFYPKIVRMDKH